MHTEGARAAFSKDKCSPVPSLLASCWFWNKDQSPEQGLQAPLDLAPACCAPLGLTSPGDVFCISICAFQPSLLFLECSTMPVAWKLLPESFSLPGKLSTHLTWTPPLYRHFRLVWLLLPLQYRSASLVKNPRRFLDHQRFTDYFEMTYLP